MWYGSAAVCLNDRNEVLMVKQGKPHEKKVWALPSGGKNEDESYDECCVREVWEETGYQVAVKRELQTKVGRSYGIDVQVVYYEVEVVGGEAKIQDPDGLIYEIAWVSVAQLHELELSFPEDREWLLAQLNGSCT